MSRDSPDSILSTKSSWPNLHTTIRNPLEGTSRNGFMFKSCSPPSTLICLDVRGRRAKLMAGLIKKQTLGGWLVFHFVTHT